MEKLRFLTQPSHHDWIGLYPRGWKHLLQCVAFEWIISRPCEVALQRSIQFECRYHSQVVCTDREYQFLYINKKIEVLGRSQYFRFVPAGMLTNIKYVHRSSSEKALTSSFTLHSNSHSKVKSSSELIHNIQDHIQDLKNDLEMSKIAQRQMKLAAHHSEMEKLAYQKFVSELLIALSQKGIARIIDDEGKEMLVKQVLNSETQSDVTEEHPPQGVLKML
ncbi:uncharacterized protein LOC110830012 isoform X2 [Zootermopsis nevadensis]|uniref:uncharacterized protein LOC110830012 isoform X2 n=1 Tax=Zootermopsis nevadensis TaxID=136037 RepID=UPI000B8EB2AF|nr:uncharacterized protein LOC110830012 isoform X2 [Zootermopsis nevadensis]